MNLTQHQAIINERLSKFGWHDSELVEFHVRKGSKLHPIPTYDVRLQINLIVGRSSDGKNLYTPVGVLFRNSRFLYVATDLIGLSSVRGQIAGLSVDPDKSELSRRIREMVVNFELPQIRDALEKCVCFRLDLIHPAGELGILASDFDVTGMNQT